MKRALRSSSRPVITMLVALGLALLGGVVLPAQAGVPLGAIAGTVTDPEGPLAEAWVDAWAEVTAEDGTTEWDVIGSGQTDESGGYVIEGLAPGAYKVEFSAWPEYLPQFWGGASDLASATAVTVEAGVTVRGIDARLAPAALISGTVTGPDGPIPDALISIWERDTSRGTIEWNEIDWTWTDDEGNYTAGGLVAGPYKIKFTDYDGTLAPTWWSNSSTKLAATPVDAVAGLEITGIDGTLKPGARIEGRVTVAGAPRTEVEVNALLLTPDGSWEPVGYDYTADANAFAVTNLPAGTYRLEFKAYSGGFETGSVQLSVGTGQVVTGYDVELTAAPVPVEPLPAPAPVPPAPVPPAPVQPAPTKKVGSPSGKAKVGKSLKAPKVTWTVPGVKVGFQWFANGKKIKKATKGKLKLTRALKGKKVSLKITGSVPGSNPTTLTTKAKKVA